MRFFVRAALIVALMSFVFCINDVGAQFLFFRNPLIGKQAPDFTLPVLGGGTANMTEYRDGREAIIFFWATWCPHCRVALDDLNERRNEFKKEDIKLIVVDIGESMSEVRYYTRGHKIELDVLLDEQTVLPGPYGVMGVPTFIFLDKDGIVRAVKHILPDNYAETLRQKK